MQEPRSAIHCLANVAVLCWSEMWLTGSPNAHTANAFSVAQVTTTTPSLSWPELFTFEHSCTARDGDNGDNGVNQAFPGYTAP